MYQKASRALDTGKKFGTC